jgi:hypothetical protein
MYQSRSTFRRSSNSGNFRRNNRSGNFGKYIDPNKFINKAVEPAQKVEFVPQNKFSDFNLHQSLKNNIISRGYILPTPIQDGSIPSI